MKNYTQSLKVIALSLMLSFGISFIYAATWIGPTAPPPGGNIDAPINTSSTAQYKNGSLGLGGLFSGYGGASFNNVVLMKSGGQLQLNNNTDTAVGFIQGVINQIQFQNSGGSPKMTIDTSTGNVGIGTISPTSPLSISSATDEILKLTNSTTNKDTIFKTGADGALVINNGGRDVVNIKDGNLEVRSPWFIYKYKGNYPYDTATSRCSCDTTTTAKDCALQVNNFSSLTDQGAECADYANINKYIYTRSQSTNKILTTSDAGTVMSGGLTVQGPITTSPGGFIFPDGKAQTKPPMSGYEIITNIGNPISNLQANCSGNKKIISGGCTTNQWRQLIASSPDSDHSWSCAIAGGTGYIEARAICADIEGQDYLFNNQHSEVACTVLGGTVDSTSVSGVKFCKFNQASCSSGWTQYSGWSATGANTCTGAIATVDTTYPSTTCGSGTPTITGQHNFSDNNTIETTTYENGVCTAPVYWSDSGTCAACSTNTATCSATRTQIGCY